MDLEEDGGVCPFMEDERCTLHEGYFPCSGHWFKTCTVYMRNIQERAGPEGVKEEKSNGTDASTRL